MTGIDKAALLKSNYGRNFGWTVLRDDEPVATLSEPKRIDTYWFRYKVEALVPEVLEDEEFWKGDLVYRNRGTGDIALSVVISGDPPSEESPFVQTRGLTIAVHATWRQRLHGMLGKS